MRGEGVSMPFVKGHAKVGGKRVGSKNAPKPSVLLESYRWVAKNPSVGTDSEMRLKIQAQFRDEFDKFLSRMESLERDYRRRGGSEESSGPVVGEAVASAESEPVEALIEELLAKCLGDA